MGTVLVDYYDAECVQCGWKHRVMYGAGLGSEWGHQLAVAVHRKATSCIAAPFEIREQPETVDAVDPVGGVSTE